MKGLTENLFLLAQGSFALRLNLKRQVLQPKPNAAIF